MSWHALLYHDVLDEPAAASGLPGAGAAVYKLDRDQFERHLAALDGAAGGPPVLVTHTAEESPARRWLLTFDDGGQSALRPTADLLDRRGWPAHFFVTAGRIGTPGFLTEAAIRELHTRGHLIGSHSWSHPVRFASLTYPAMVGEWTRSTQRLAALLGEPVTVASVPGGYYSRTVARAAADAGIRVLFTSEPVSRATRVHGCLVLGRFAITRRTTPARAAALAAGRPGPRAAQWLAWTTRKAAKRLAGDFYVSAREALLARNTSR